MACTCPQLAAIATLLARTEVDALAARLDTQLRLALLDIDRATQEQVLLRAREQVQAAHLASLDLRTRLGDAAASERSLLQTRLLQVGGERARSSALATDARARLAGLLGVPVAAGVLFPFFGILISPMFAAFAMSASSISVVLNSLRLRGVRI